MTQHSYMTWHLKSEKMSDTYNLHIQNTQKKNMAYANSQNSWSVSKQKINMKSTYKWHNLASGQADTSDLAA
jgi:hypothetical protein